MARRYNVVRVNVCDSQSWYNSRSLIYYKKACTLLLESFYIMVKLQNIFKNILSWKCHRSRAGQERVLHLQARPIIALHSWFFWYCSTMIANCWPCYYKISASFDFCKYARVILIIVLKFFLSPMGWVCRTFLPALLICTLNYANLDLIHYCHFTQEMLTSKQWPDLKNIAHQNKCNNLRRL